jgi:uncharacterized repeat protein (TIGR03803 family)
MTPQGNFTKIYQFQGSSNDGNGPVGIVQGRDGNFYGMSASGSQVRCTSYCGAVFKVTPNGHLTILHTFNGRDGNYPSAQLLLATDGNFYGTTFEGGEYLEGTVFQMTPSGGVTSLYSFCHQDNCADGAGPYSGVMEAIDGTLYGTTTGGGTTGCTTCGTIFKITTSGNLTTLFSFNNTSSGGSPDGLLQATNGNFYGLTSGGGTSYLGTFFQFFTTGKTLSVVTSGNGTETSIDGIINCPGTCSHIYPNNTPVTLNASPDQGWVFNGWGGACTGSGSCQVSMTQDQTVYGSFSPLYTLTVSVTGNGSVITNDGFINCPGVCSHVYVAGTPVVLNGVPAQGWSLSSWGGYCVGTPSSCTVAMSHDQSVNVAFTQNSYTLSVSLSGSGTVTSTDGFINCPGSCSHTYLSLTPVTMNAAPAQGWNFSGWSGACSGVGPCNISLIGNLGVSAYFMQPGSGLHFGPVTPCRLVDTRYSNGGSGPISGGTYQTFNLPQLAQSKGCADLSSAAAYSLNVTLVPFEHAPLSYLTIWPAGLAQPMTSTMNSLDGRVKANAAVVPGGVNSSVNVFVTDTTDVVLDVDGYFAPPGPGNLQFYPLAPCRVADTRKDSFPQGLGTPHLSAGVARDLPVLNAASCNIPPGAQAYSLNFTAIPYPNMGDQLGYLEVWPTGQLPQHPVSTLNNPTGTFVANAAIVPAGTGHDITVYPSSDTDLAIDINGYFAAPGTGGLSLYPAPPCRVFDSRKVGSGQPFTGTLAPPVDVVGSVCAPPGTAQAYTLNVTVVPSGNLSYLTLWPDSEGQPIVSTLNAADGWITSNMAIVPTVNGSVDAYEAGMTQLILDISSYFAP